MPAGGYNKRGGNLIMLKFNKQQAIYMCHIGSILYDGYKVGINILFHR